MQRRNTPYALSAFLLLVVSTSFSQTPAALSARINACFNASKHEVAENLCLYYNNRFQWASSYGAVDRFASGTYTISNDTVYLDSHRPPPFTIRAALVKTIPAGKIQLVFKNAGQHASYINAEAGSTSIEGVDRLKKSGPDFLTLIPMPAGSSIRLVHTLFDEQGADYPLPANANQYTILISDSIGQTAFDHLPLVWDGTNLKSAAESSATTFRFTAQYPSYEEIPWTGTEKPSRDAFDQWAGAQKAAFGALEQKHAEELRIEALAATKKMKRCLVSNWNDAYAIAKENRAGVIVLMGEDSIPVSNDASNDTTSTPNRKELLAEVYYRFFANDNKLPAFYQLRSKDAEQHFRVSILPAQLILDPQGRLLYKNEGSLMDAAALHSVWEQIRDEEARINDSIVQHFKDGATDSAGLFRQIETIAGAESSLKKALEDAGVNSRSLINEVVLRYYVKQPFNAENYDNVSAAYFPGDSWRNLSASNTMPLATPAIRYLVNHFAERQRAHNGATKEVNDSLISRAYFGLLSTMSYVRYNQGSMGTEPDSAVVYLKKMITGAERYTDFFTSISCLQSEIERNADMSLPLEKRRAVIPDFLSRYFGDSLPSKASVDSAAAAIYKNMRAADNKVMIHTYLASDSTEKAFVQIGNSVAGFFLTMQARLLLDAAPDANITLKMLQQSGALFLLEKAASYNPVAASYLMRRNYAYTLYLSGRSQPAIALLQQVITEMKLPSNKYLATEERLKLTNENLRAMKGGRPISWTVAGLTDY